MFFENKELTEQKIFKSQNLFKNHVRLGAAIKAKWLGVRNCTYTEKPTSLLALFGV